MGHLEMLNGPSELCREWMCLKTGVFAGASQKILDVLLQLVQDGATPLIHGLCAFELRIEPFELFTQLAILIVHWQPSKLERTAGVSLALPSLFVAVAAEQLASAMLAPLPQGAADLIG